jgi:F-type H+-transporting ATPase subunit delta
VTIVAGNDVSRTYAGALLEIAQQKNILPAIEEEMGFLASLVNEERELMLYLNAPGVSKDSKKELVDKVFAGKLSDVAINFFKVLIDNNRQSLIRDVYQSLVHEIDVINNRQRVKVTTSAKLGTDMVQKIKDALTDKFKKVIILDEVIDPKIIGGVVIKIGDLIIDGSLAKDLRNIREKLLLSKVRSEMVYED